MSSKDLEPKMQGIIFRTGELQEHHELGIRVSYHHSLIREQTELSQTSDAKISYLSNSASRKIQDTHKKQKHGIS